MRFMLKLARIIVKRGTYKYDRWRQLQDFRGFRSKGSKVWLDIQDFAEIPMSVFKQYDELRQSLADEIMVAIEDTMAETEIGSVKKRLQPEDLDFEADRIERSSIILYS